MPLLDVTEVLNDPDFADVFSVLRRSEAVGNNGRAVITEQQTDGVVGVVTIASPNDLVRFDAGQMTGRGIMIVTTFRLRASAQGVQPDQVIWDGATYTVKGIDPYHRFGAGFIEALAMSMNASTPPPT